MSYFIIILFFSIFALILINPDVSLLYSLQGLQLWFHKMIPTLFPFMLLSGTIIRLNLTEQITSWFYPIFKPIFQLKKNAIYCILFGFLCGFPMGAKVISDLYEINKISKREAEYLLAFCNNIGPIYFCGFVLPLLECKLILPYLFAMYGIPLLYGLILRYTKYRNLYINTDCEIKEDNVFTDKNTETKIKFIDLLQALNDSVCTSGKSILILGGYMILFNLLFVIPHITCKPFIKYIAPLIEISGGIMMLGKTYPYYTLIVLTFGGLSCIAQTGVCIENTDLSLENYILNKIILTLLTIFYYLFWLLLYPSTFLL